MYRFSLPVLFLLSLLAQTSAAQVTDAFSDGDFTSDPAWTGTTEQWTVTPVDGDPALRSNGLAEADTIYLATPSGVSSGTWAFTFRYDGVNLSNFNGARVFLLSNTADLSGEVFGYYIQLGASNSDEVRLYRLDGDPDGGRNELGRSATPLLEGESGVLAIEVTRSAEGAWSVRVDGTEVLTAEDATYTSGPFFGVWVKHSGSAPQAYTFDDFVVTGEQGPADTTPPQVAEGRYTASDPAFVLRFSEPIDAGTVTPSAFTISGVGNPASAAVQEGDAARVRLGLSAPLATGAYEIDVTGIADLAGNAIRDTTFTVEVDVDTEAPMLVGARARSVQSVEVTFSEPVVNGCAPERYTISDVGPPAEVRCPDGEPSATYELVLASALNRGVTYTLTVRGVEDEAGNRLDEATADFTFAGAAEAPAPGEIVINEILYDPIADTRDNEPDQPEYVELYNTTDRALSLAGLLLAEPPDEDGKVSTTPLPESDVLPPGGYALVFDDD
ncbi:MAG: Ig-like domain-containing protein, partial [Rhodothermales bacterium]